MSPAPGFSINWDAGPSSQIEVFSPDLDAHADSYKLKFTGRFRSTLRPPQRSLQLGPKVLERFRSQLDKLFVAVDARAVPGAAAAPTGAEIIKKTQDFGGQLLGTIVPANVQAE